MNYTVDWSDSALDELAAIWMQATDRAAVTAAEATIHRSLATDPTGNGHFVREGLWRLMVHPLLVHYEIDSGNRFVWITQVDAQP